MSFSPRSLARRRAIAEEFYLNEGEIRDLDASGMIVGSHGANHFLFSKLSAEQQREEIAASFSLS